MNNSITRNLAHVSIGLGAYNVAKNSDISFKGSLLIGVSSFVLTKSINFLLRIHKENPIELVDNSISKDKTWKEKEDSRQMINDTVRTL